MCLSCVVWPGTLSERDNPASTNRKDGRVRGSGKLCAITSSNVPRPSAVSTTTELGRNLSFTSEMAAAVLFDLTVHIKFMVGRAFVLDSSPSGSSLRSSCSVS